MTGLASSAVAMSAMVTLLPGVGCLQKPRLVWLICAIFIVVLVPFSGLPLAAYVRGWMGDLSITSLVLVLTTLLRQLCGCSLNCTENKILLFFIIALAALGLYPMALGIGYFDPYRLGYGNPWFMGGLLLLAIACFRRLQVIALSIALALLAWGVGWYESTNLWDYLLDPLLAIYAILALFKHGLQLLPRLQKD